MELFGIIRIWIATVIDQSVGCERRELWLHPKEFKYLCINWEGKADKDNGEEETKRTYCYGNENNNVLLLSFGH